jgi:phage baseplate assembly protein W
MTQTINIAYPFAIGPRGRTATATDPDHIKQLIEQLLFTDPGERVNRPGFGTGMRQLVFAPNSLELAATVQYTMQAALQRDLGDLIQIDALTVTSQDATLQIYVEYILRQTNEVGIAQLSRSL